MVFETGFHCVYILVGLKLCVDQASQEFRGAPTLLRECYGICYCPVFCFVFKLSHKTFVALASGD